MQGLGFSTHNVHLVLSGDKDVTRRVIKSVPTHVARIEHASRKLWSMLDADGVLVGTLRSRYYEGETVYMREQWLLTEGEVLYRADHPATDRRWATSRFMPANASRQLLNVVSMRAEPLHCIDDDDARREGISPSGVAPEGPREHFARLWGQINGISGEAAWHVNPWVYRIEITRTKTEKTHG